VVTKTTKKAKAHEFCESNSVEGSDQSQCDFIKNFIVLNIINFAGMTSREKDKILWNVRRILLP